jgi:hypothetical protein
MKFFAAILSLILAFILQFWFASAGIAIDFVFAALIAFAFVFEFWEVFFFVALSLFVINWQPAISFTLGAFSVLPLLAYGFRRWFHWQGWAGNLAAIAVGLLILYLCVSPSLLIGNFRSFFFDLFISMIFGAAVFFGLNYSYRR